jgi:hypothetical protein
LRAPWRRSSPQMAARRLLIVMLVLLGVSTLAAALVPQRTIERHGTTGTGTQPPNTPRRPASHRLPAPTKIPSAARSSRSSPRLVGDQLRLLVRSRFPAEITIPRSASSASRRPTRPPASSCSSTARGRSASSS